MLYMAYLVTQCPYSDHQGSLTSSDATFSHLVLFYCLRSKRVRHLSDAFAVGVFLKVFFAFSEAALDALSIDLLRLSCSDCECDLTASTDLQSAKMTFRTIGSILSVVTTGLLPCGCLRKR